ncbi:MAG: hypothetical protein M0R06_03335 [Sphaerochaeta sp.]|jgi:hypothetical protein|nr:hypothetical protein [Sphaerochaeta sp.]
MAYSGTGAGTVGDPYIITTVAQLQEMEDYPSASFALGNDIDASATRSWNQGTGAYSNYYYGFDPVGTFTGTFDGNGYTISNLYINRTSENGASGSTTVGMFSQILRHTAGGFIKDLRMVNVDISGGTRVGAVAGLNTLALTGVMAYSNVYVSGIVRGTNESDGLGGVIGYADGDGHDGFLTFTDCRFSGIVRDTTDKSADKYIGGFVGKERAAQFTNCIVSVLIDLDYDSTAGLTYVGGFCGYAYDSDSLFAGCSASGKIQANCVTTSAFNAIGGFFGINNATASSCHENICSVDVENLSASAAYVGGFVGRNEGVSNITECGATGNVDSKSTHATVNHVGGFVGRLAAGTIQDCYAKGNVCMSSGIGHADMRIGGFVGEMQLVSSVLDNDYSVGAVYADGTPTNGGGFCGLKTLGTHTNCFYDNETSGWTTDGGSATGKSTTLMKTQSTFTDAGWDFTNVWRLPSYTRSPGLPNMVWLSQTDHYEGFDSGVKDADSFQVSIPTTNEVHWVESLDSLLAGTAGDEWKIGSNKLDTPLSPTNFGVKQQSTHGSKNMQPQKINDVILFVDYVGRKIREMTVGEYEGKYVSNDMTSLAEHITETGIICTAHQRNPDPIDWCVLTDGSLIGMVYDREQNVVAWFDCPIDGSVLSVCVTPSTDEDDVWITVKRTIDSADKLYIEKFSTRLPVDIEDSFFVDSGITTSVTDSDTITGLDHLIGKKVAVLADGEIIYHGTEDESVVSAAGEVTLPASATYTTVQVGLPYTSILKPMRLVANGPEGSSLASLTRIPELKISFGDTKGAKYGDSETDLYDVNFDDERLENDSDIAGLFSGDVRVSMQGGISTANPILIENSSPFPMLVKSIIPSFEQSGR